MSGIAGIVALYVFAMASFGLLYATGHRNMVPGEKRTYLFEDEDGNKVNPFSSTSEGATAREEREWKYDP